MEFTYIDNGNYPAFRNLLPQTQAVLFENNPTYHAIGAVIDDTACGILIYEMDNEELRLCHIYYIAVSERYREQRVASTMLDTFTRLAYEAIWYPICTFPAVDYNDPIYGLFAANAHYTIAEEAGGAFLIPGGDFKKRMKVHLRQEYALMDLAHCSVAFRNEAYEICWENGIVLDSGASKVVPECSLVLERDQKLSAFLVTSRYSDGDYEISFIYHAHRNESNEMVGLLLEGLSHLYGHIAEDAGLHINATNPRVEALLERLFGDKLVCEHRYFTASYED